MSAVALLATAAFAGSADAQSLPAAADILARYQKEIGGKQALEGKTQMYSSGEFSMPAAGVTGSFESFAARPNKAAMRVSIGGFGEVRSGYNGEVAWSINPMEGPRLIEGAEKAQTVDESAFDSMLRDIANYTSAETVELTTLGGKQCHKIKLVWKSGRETFDCFSPETGLLVGTLSRQESNMGTIDAVTLYDDYRVFEGLRMPTKITIQVMGMDQVVTLTDVKFSNLPENAFELPAEIRALIRG